MTFDFLAVRNRTAPTSSLYPDLGALPGRVEAEPTDGARVPLPVERVVVQRYDGVAWNDIADLESPGQIDAILTDCRLFLVSSAVDEVIPRAVNVPAEGQVVAQCRHEWIARLEADPPELIVDTAVADRLGGRLFPLEGFDALAELVRQRYTRVDTVDDAPIYRLRPNGPTP